ncbi:MAG: acyl carrier protein [Deltaproteobacteria bacterium]|nr:acyl carrier protein [Deltaproteobacteria bacterium]
MDEQGIFSKMVEILRAYTKDPSILDKATMETHILNDLKVNSARLVDVIIKCEDVFGITIEDEEADKIGTIGEAVAIIKNKLG